MNIVAFLFSVFFLSLSVVAHHTAYSAVLKWELAHGEYGFNVRNNCSSERKQFESVLVRTKKMEL